MTRLKEFTASMEKASESDPMMRRWLYGTKELERRLYERLIHLCKYPDMIPNELVAVYADVLVEALESEQVEGTVIFSEGLTASLTALVENLEGSGDPQVQEKAKRIRDAIVK